MTIFEHSIIRNQDIPGPGTIKSLNPATEETIGTVTALDKEGAIDAVKAAREAYPEWSRTSVAERARLIDEMEDLRQAQGQLDRDVRKLRATEAELST